MKIETKRGIARILGNFMVSFFAPLTGGNVANTLFNIDLEFWQTVLIALISSIFVTGLVLGKEITAYGKRPIT